MKKAKLRELLKERENAQKTEEIVQNEPIQEKKSYKLCKKGKKGDK